LLTSNYNFSCKSTNDANVALVSTQNVSNRSVTRDTKLTGTLVPNATRASQITQLRELNCTESY